MDKADEKQYSRYFKAIGDPTRLKILTLLSGQEMSVNEVTAKIGLSQPTVSRHLSILRDAGAIKDRRDGQNVYYSIDKVSVNDCCAGFCNCLQITIRKKSLKKK